MKLTTPILRLLLLAVLVSAGATPSNPMLPAAVAADSCLFGRIDDFREDGLELADPDVHLVPLLITYSPNGVLDFDDCQVNRYFALTAATCLGTDSTQLQLTIRLKAFGSQSNTDVFYLGTNGQIRWGLRMSMLGALFGAGATWNAGDTATAVLDLQNMPPSDTHPSYGPPYPAGVVDVLQWVHHDGNLDILVADDTCVDYLALAIRPGGTTPVRPTSWGRLKLIYR